MDLGTLLILLGAVTIFVVMGSTRAWEQSQLGKSAYSALELAAGSGDRPVTVIIGGARINFAKIRSVDFVKSFSRRECTVVGTFVEDDRTQPERRVRLDLNAISAVIDHDPMTSIAHQIGKSLSDES